jgi:hypothetical protein
MKMIYLDLPSKVVDLILIVEVEVVLEALIIALSKEMMIYKVLLIELRRNLHLINMTFQLEKTRTFNKMDTRIIECSNKIIYKYIKQSL